MNDKIEKNGDGWPPGAHAHSESRFSATDRHAGRFVKMVARAILFAMCSLPASAGLYDAWVYRVKIQFVGYNRAETLTNFPALVVFNPGIPGFRYGAFASPNGYDLRFVNANATKELNYEVEQWNTNANSYVWVQVDQLASSNDYIWAYYRNPAATSAPPVYTTNGTTWSSGYVGVWHMNQPSALDSTTNRLNGTASGGVSQTGNGVVGAANAFDGGGSSYITMADNAKFALGTTFTLSAWINTTMYGGTGNGQSILGMWGAGQLLWGLGANSSNLYCFLQNVNWAANTPGVVTGTWEHIAFTSFCHQDGGGLTSVVPNTREN